MKPRRMIAAVPIVFCLVAPLGWSGCTERPGEEAQAKAAPAPDAAVLASEDAGSADEGELLHITLLPYHPGQLWSVGTGEFDSRNRYSSAVELGEVELPPEKRMELCTGVLISPRLVLTAAICVCSPRQAVRSGGGQSVLDAKACAKTVDVKATLYGPPAHQGRSEERSAVYSGVVRVHPEFKRVDDGRNENVSNEADLAVIVLDRAANVPPVELAESDVKIGESLVVVGYGYPSPKAEEAFGPLERRFSEHRVTEVLKSGGRVAFYRPANYPYAGAMGGPCLRQTAQGMRLAGILSTSILWREAFFTSVYPYREWLRAEIRSAPVP